MYAVRWSVLIAAIFMGVLPYVPLPHPYTGRTVLSISKERLERLPVFPMTTDGWPSVQAGRLLNVSYLPAASKVLGAETVAIAPGEHGNLALLDRDGVLHVTKGPDHITIESSGRIGVVGRPLGYTYDAEKRLVICDSVAGLLRYDASEDSMTILANALPDGFVRAGSQLVPTASPQPCSLTSLAATTAFPLLSSTPHRTPLRFVNALDISRHTGKIFFSSATDQTLSWHGPDRLGGSGFYDTMTGAKMNLVHGSPTGRLLVYDPATKKVTCLLESLFFANGVALAPNDEFVLVCESYGARVLRLWLKGPREGTSDTFVDRLPGFPDGISPRDGGGYWVSIVNPPNVLGRLAGSLAVRALLGHIMPLVEPLVKKFGCVAKVSANGTKQSLLMDIKGSHVQSVASAHQHGRKLYLGNLMGAGVSVLELAEGE